MKQFLETTANLRSQSLIVPFINNITYRNHFWRLFFSPPTTFPHQFFPTHFARCQLVQKLTAQLTAPTSLTVTFICSYHILVVLLSDDTLPPTLQLSTHRFITSFVKSTINYQHININQHTRVFLSEIISSPRGFHVTIYTVPNVT